MLAEACEIIAVMVLSEIFICQNPVFAVLLIYVIFIG